MMLQIGDFLFGYPIVGVVGPVITVRLPGDITIEYDAAHFPSEVLRLLRENGAHVPARPSV